ncbi:MAG: ADP-forming succinate--CoA ligase subunit beta [Sphingomonadales bacterium]|nr:ADP-forming succinate--CoA ligase subunit beta [Sphingomonadales bacterium]MBM3923319.1 ADP-forming succinate--CoA ligase subunit beta [Sphingomonadales bacterium]MBM3931439.1 ADP-forming succinate--CoA ligase subunit beta [Sphingomonadales bacterium]
MNIHEYQGKALLSQYGVTVQRGILASTPDEAVQAANALHEQTGTSWWVVKAQVHAGGRGKGGGIKLAKSLEQVQDLSSQILGMQLVTPQTGSAGKKVHSVLIAEDVYAPGPSPIQEFYLSVLLDRAQGGFVMVYSPEGGMDIEEVAEKHPEKIYREWIDPTIGFQAYQARRVALNLGLSGQAFKQMVAFCQKLVKAFEGVEASLFEINPVLKTSDDRILAVDAKVNIDDNALMRVPDIAAMHDPREEDPTELKAASFNLNYVKLDGNVGCMVNGAGLAMATMDMIQLSGGSPANFLDVGGTASAERVAQAFNIILEDPNVKAILVNIFGGIVRCDRVANGIVEACKTLGDLRVPLIVRLQGTNANEAKAILEASGLPIRAAITLEDAAKAVSDSLAA